MTEYLTAGSVATIAGYFFGAYLSGFTAGKAQLFILRVKEML